MIDLIQQHIAYAPYLIFLAILLAGLNLPISLDVIMITSAVIAATLVPEYTIPLYFAILIGSYFSAWIAYWMGRTLGRKLLKFRLVGKMLPDERIDKIGNFYNKYGLWTLMIGRFIPFGTRNCIFMTTGLSKVHFGKFAIRDAIACPIWATTCFFLFFSLGNNYEALIAGVKKANLAIFAVFAVALITIFWYNRRKKKARNKNDQSL